MKYKLNSLQILAAGFALVILAGAALLCLPFATRQGISFFDALFISTSATCVTGLVVCDTFTTFTLFGQAVILALIQVGGLGFMMVAILFWMALGRRIGLAQRALLMESVGIRQLGGIVRFTRRVLLGTALIEGVGALLLASRFCPKFGLATGLWYGVFHSVSAFCNAGFDLMGRQTPYFSLTAFAEDWVVNLTVMGLILAGGIGFFVWNDLVEKGLHWKRWRLHTRIMISATLILTLGGAAAFYLLEKDGAFAHLSPSGQVLAALFQSVTPRTAGFNTVDLGQLSEAGSLLTILLMFIGAGAGSTGGGMKVTTFVVIALSVLVRVRRRREMELCGRRLEEDVLKAACPAAALHGTLFLLGAFVLCCQGVELKAALFESVSAISTVGLSLSLTPTLPALSRLVLIFLMYAGRVGSLSVAMAVTRKGSRAKLRNVTEKIILG